MEIEYLIEDLDGVLKFFADEYKVGDGKEVSGFEYFVDCGKKKVVFKLYIKKKE